MWDFLGYIWLTYTSFAAVMGVRGQPPMTTFTMFFAAIDGDCWVLCGNRAGAYPPLVDDVPDCERADIISFWGVISN